MPERLLESCIPWAMLTSATNLLNFNVVIKKDDQQDVFFHSIVKLNVSETRKSKNWKSYMNTVKNVSMASHKLPHFLSEHVSIVKNLTQKIWSWSVDICGNRERKTWRGVNSTPQLKWGKSSTHRGHTMVLYFKGNVLTSVHSLQLRPFAYDL